MDPAAFAAGLAVAFGLVLVGNHVLWTVADRLAARIEAWVVAIGAGGGGR